MFFQTNNDINNNKKKENLINQIRNVINNSPFKDKMLESFNSNISLFSTNELEIIKNYIFSLDKEIIMKYLLAKQNEYDEIIFKLKSIKSEKEKLMKNNEERIFRINQENEAKTIITSLN